MTEFEGNDDDNDDDDDDDGGGGALNTEHWALNTEFIKHTCERRINKTVTQNTIIGLLLQQLI